MTEATAQLLASFEALPLEEQHQLVAEILRRTGELPGHPLPDSHLTILADELFQQLDTEEARDAEAGQE